jgi:cobalamin-dependent methionine synthase I
MYGDSPHGLGSWIDKVKDQIRENNLGDPVKSIKETTDRIAENAKRTLGGVPAQQMNNLMSAVDKARGALKSDIAEGIDQGVGGGAGSALKQLKPYLIGGGLLLAGLVVVLYLRKKR